MSPRDSFEKLGDDNYYHWEYNQRMKLMRKGLLAHIVRPESDKTYDRTTQQWFENDLKALGMIAGGVAPTHQVYTRDAQTALEAWQRLELHYNRDSMKNQIKINKRLHNFKMDEGTRMTTHIDRFKELVFQLQSIGNDMPETQQIVLLLGSIGSQYDVLVSILENKPNITLAQVMETLVNSDKDKETHTNTEELAFRADGRVTKGSFDGNCDHCGKKGHKKSDCWQLNGRPSGRSHGRSGHGGRGGGRNGRRGNHHAARAQLDFAFTALSATTNKMQNKDWLVDSGASSHMCWDKNQFTSLVKLESPIEVQIANGKWINAIGRGNVRIVLTDGTVMALSNVLFIPTLDRNLLSVPALTAYDVAVRFLRGTCIFMVENKRIFSPPKIGGGFYLTIEHPALDDGLHYESAMATGSSSAWEELHAKLGHIPASSYKRLVDTVDGVPHVPASELDSSNLCSGCCYGKMRAANFPRYPTDKVKASRPLELVHCDLFGPVHVATPGGCRYAIVFIDDFTRYTWIDFMKTKDEALSKFKDFKARVERQSGRAIQRFRTDNGGEFTSKAFEKFLRESGIVHETTTPHTPQQNGLDERTNRTIVEKTRCQLYHKMIKLQWWAESAYTAVRMMNMTPNSVNLLTPHELWTGCRPVVSDAQVFGEEGFAHVAEEKKKKLAPRAFKCTFMGYADGTKGYRVLNHDTNKIQIVRTIKMATVNRQLRIPSDMADYGSDDEDDQQPVMVPGLPSKDHPPAQRGVNSGPTASPRDVPMTQSIEDDDLMVFPVRTRTVRKSDEMGTMRPVQKVARHSGDSTVKDWTRIDQRKYQKHANDTEVKDARHVNTNHVDYEIALSAHVVPSSYTAALDSEESPQWQQAIRDELTSLEENNTWDVVELPASRRAVGCRWVFAHKLNERGEVVRHKARLVAQGFSQRYGEDYLATYSPVANVTSVRLFLAIAASEGMRVEQCDVDTAFLNGELEEEIYMNLPEGIELLNEVGNASGVSSRCNNKADTPLHDDDDGGPSAPMVDGTKPLVCRLRKSLYGLKQASRVWNKTIDGRLRELGLIPTSADPCVYVRGTGDDRCMICLYVDDLLIASKAQACIRDVKTHLKSSFKIKDLVLVRFVLGIEVRYDHSTRTLQLLQSSYIDQIVDRFNQQNARPTFVPTDTGSDLDLLPTSVSDTDSMERRPYRSIIGCLMYLSGCTRPDISVAVLKLSQHLESPTPHHWNSAIRVVRYLKTTRDYGQHYDGTSNSELVAYSDADWGSSKGDRRSISGSILMMCGGPVAWKATVQKSVALSSTEAEYMALSDFVKECIWTQQLLSELVTKPVGAVTVYEDNQGAIALATNNGYHARTKHIDIRYHFVREKIERGAIQLAYIATANQLADFLTKLLPGKRLRYLLEKIGIGPVATIAGITD